MTRPVISILSSSPIADALEILESGGFRHIPVLSQEHQLLGMISDRDLMHCRCHLDMGCVLCSGDKQGISVEVVMKDHVLSASVDTDARYIARLFVEQRIGAMPIMENGQLVGMITRSDVLRAVMVHFDLNIWS